MAIQSPIRLGLIGAGRQGRAIISAVDRTAHARLVLVSSNNPETCARVGTDCQILTDWRSMLNPALLDGVIIATPPVTHSTIANAVLIAHLPVLVETPLAMNIADAITLKKLASLHLVMVNHTILANPGYRFLKELVKGNAGGPILAIRGYAGAKSVLHPDIPVLWELGEQMLAMCIDLLDASEPDDLSARYIKRQPTQNGCNETVELRFEFSQEVDVRVRLSNTLEQRMYYFAVYFDQLTLVYDGSSILTLHPPAPGFSIPDDDGQTIKLPKEEPLVNMITWFTLAIANRTNDPWSLNLGVDVIALLALCQAALELPCG